MPRARLKLLSALSEPWAVIEITGSGDGGAGGVGRKFRALCSTPEPQWTICMAPGVLAIVNGEPVIAVRAPVLGSKEKPLMLVPV